MTKKILVVDDESSIREALSKVLHAEDYEVVSAENGQEAIEKFGAEKIDLLLSPCRRLVKFLQKGCVGCSASRTRRRPPA